MSTLKRKDIQLAEPFSESRLLNQGRYHTKWSPPYLLQPKLNGERCRAIVESGRCLLLSSTDNIISTVPLINKSLLSFPNGEYDGELYVHGWTFSQIHSVVSTTSSVHPDHSKMQYHIFDLIHPTAHQAARLTRLNEIFVESDRVKKVPVTIAMNLEQVYSAYEGFIYNNYEGFIIRELSSSYTRRRTGHMMKFKPKQTDTYLITGVFEATSESGKPLGMVGAFCCIDDMSTYFKVGAGKLSHDQRRELWKLFSLDASTLIGKFLKVEYQTLSDKEGVPLFSRAVEIL